MALTLSQLEQYDLAAGWPAQLVPRAAATEQAESSGDPSAIGPGGSWGLFQIQPQAWPDITRTWDPLQQSKAGLQVYRQQGWNAWTTDQSINGQQPAYLQYLAGAQKAAGQQGTAPQSSSSAGGSCDAASGSWSDAKCGPLDIACVVKNWSGGILCKFRQAGVLAATGAQILIGLVVLGVGLWFLIRNTGLGQDIRKAVKTGEHAALAAAA